MRARSQVSPEAETGWPPLLRGPRCCGGAGALSEGIRGCAQPLAPQLRGTGAGGGGPASWRDHRCSAPVLGEMEGHVPELVVNWAISKASEIIHDDPIHNNTIRFERVAI